MPDLATKPPGPLSGDDASETLNQVGVLVSRPKLWANWLAEHPDRAELFKEIFSSVVRLRAATGWSDDQILEGLGCNTKTKEELSSLTKEHLESCLGYMCWVEELVDRHDLILDRREIVRQAARFFTAAGRDLEKVKVIMSWGTFSPADFLELGEVEQGWQLARDLLEQVGSEPVRRMGGELTNATEAPLHLSPKRVETLAKPEAEELLGPRVAARMREHLAACEGCRAAAGTGDSAPALAQGAAATLSD